MNWCLYHSEQAQFLGPVTETRMPGPSGRYNDCGQQAFRYETLPGPMVNFHSTNFFLLVMKKVTKFVNCSETYHLTDFFPAISGLPIS